MKWQRHALFGFLLAIGAIVASALENTQIDMAVHVRWVLDLKKKLGYESFDRARSNKPWEGQQGIVFLTPDELLVYQLKPRSSALSSAVINGNPAAFYLQIEILDARNGNPIKSLLLPCSSESGKVMPLSGGAFLAQSGNVLSLYSAKFEQVASRQLLVATAVQSQEWQIDVSPSKTRVIAVHQEAWEEPEDPKGKHKQTKSKADVEVLDPDTLKTTKAFTVSYLDRWSAEDDDIIAANPAADDEEVSLGIMDFDGKWQPFKTSAENNDPDCPYEMKALEHQLIAAHDCDDLVVVTHSGYVRLSQAEGDSSMLISIAGADHYLAEAFAAPEVRRIFISVYDIDKKARVAWVSQQNSAVYYAVSASGTLAIIDGGKMKFYEPAEVVQTPH